MASGDEIEYRRGRGQDMSGSSGELTPIKVRAKFFFEGEKKFFVKGVTYGPFAPDADGQPEAAS